MTTFNKNYSTLNRINILILLIFLSFTGTAQYVTVNSSCGFADGSGNPYRPLVCNYGIQFLQDDVGNWFISPEQGYSRNWSTPDSKFMFDPISGDHVNSPSNVSLSESKLPADLARIKGLGFTEIRLSGMGINITSGGVATYPTGSQTTYFTLLDHFMSQASTAGIRVIFILGGGNNTFSNNAAYKSFMNTIAAHYATNTSLMGYDLYNEPEYTLWQSIPNDKYNITKMVTEWNNAIKKFDPNHLTTIGLVSPRSVSEFDPVVLPLDFVSFHFYPLSNHYDVTDANSLMDTYYYWLSRTMTVPWIIGETGYAGTDTPNGGEPSIYGTAADQSSFAVHTLQQSVNCGCKGYSWWKYQQTTWGMANEDYLGLYDSYTGSADGGPKAATTAFAAYSGLIQTTSSCSQPGNYYTALNGTSYMNQGYVKDQNGNPIVNAVITGKENSTNTDYTSFTDATGHFAISSGGNTFYRITVSYPGYSTQIQANPTPGNAYNYTITPVNVNLWAKDWSNSSDPINTISNNWNLSSFDMFYKGDFNGDGKQDLLCVKYTDGINQTDRMVILTYTNSFPVVGSGPDYNISSGWTLLWDNQSNGSNGGGIYPYRNNLTVGDFDGNGTDDIISINSGGAWSTWFTFVPNANPVNATWQWQDSDYGTSNNPSHPMSYMHGYSNSVIAGDFYNVGKAAVIVVTASNWITSFQLSSGGVWTWIQSNNGLTNNSSASMSYLTPYDTQLIAGDFDGDGQKEIVGNALSAGDMALVKPYWNSTLSQWVWTQKWHETYNANTDMFPFRSNLNVGKYDPNMNKDKIIGFNSINIACFGFDSGYNLYWDGSAATSISDWNISPTAYKYLLINTDPDTYQQQLLAIRGSAANLYTFKINKESQVPCITLHRPDMLSNTAGSETPAPITDMILFPNPNNGKFDIWLPPSENKQKIQLTVFDMQGKEVLNTQYDTNENGNNINLSLDNIERGVYFVRCTTGNTSYTKKIVVM